VALDGKGAELSGARLDAAMSRLPAHARPRVVAHVPRMPLTDGYRPKRRTVAFEAAVAQVLFRLGPAGYELAPEPAVPLESTVSLEG